MAPISSLLIWCQVPPWNTYFSLTWLTLCSDKKITKGCFIWSIHWSHSKNVVLLGCFSSVFFFSQNFQNMTAKQGRTASHHMHNCEPSWEKDLPGFYTAPPFSNSSNQYVMFDECGKHQNQYFSVVTFSNFISCRNAELNLSVSIRNTSLTTIEFWKNIFCSSQKRKSIFCYHSGIDKFFHWNRMFVKIGQK